MDTLYWNNICLISPLEEKYIAARLKEKNLSLSVSYFGLGRPMSLYEKIQKDLNAGALGAEVMVSTDTDVFQDPNLLLSHGDFLDARHFLPQRKEKALFTLCHPEGFFVPFIVIPLIMVYHRALLSEKEVPSTLEALSSQKWNRRFAFGGLHNSAGKSLLKSLWYQYGKETATRILAHAHCPSMPAAAFQMVIKKQVPLAIVPTIFAKRKGISSLGAKWPEDGAVPIPSYLAIQKKTREENIQFISQTLLSQEFQHLLYTQGSIIPSHPALSFEFDDKPFLPLMSIDWSFWHHFSHEALYEMTAQKNKGLHL